MGRVVILSPATRSNMLMVSKVFPLADETTTVGRETVTSRRSTPHSDVSSSAALPTVRWGPTTNPLDTTERRGDLRLDEEKDEVLAWVRPRSISFSPYFTPYTNVHVPQARRYVASHPYGGPPPPRSEHESSHPTRQPAQQRGAPQQQCQ